MFTGSEDRGGDCVNLCICTGRLECTLNLGHPLGKPDPGVAVQNKGAVGVGKHARKDTVYVSVLISANSSFDPLFLISK